MPIAFILCERRLKNEGQKNGIGNIVRDEREYLVMKIFVRNWKRLL